MTQLQPLDDMTELRDGLKKLRQRVDRLGIPRLEEHKDKPIREVEDYGSAAKRLVPYMILETLPFGSLVNCMRDPTATPRAYGSALIRDILKVGLYGLPAYALYKGIEALAS